MSSEGGSAGSSGIAVRPVSAADAIGLFSLFERDGCPCYCRWFHFSGDKNDWLARCALEPDANRRELAEALDAARDDGRGVVAVAPAGEIVGWAKLAPASVMSKALGQRYYQAIPAVVAARGRTDAFVLACFLVAPDWRRRGVARALAAGAVRIARERWRARSVIAFPRRISEPTADGQLYTGPIAALEAAGLREVGGDPVYPVLEIAWPDA